VTINPIKLAAYDAFAVALSAKLDEAMRKRGFSFSRLALRAGLARQTIINVTKARPNVSLRSLLAIADALDCDLTVDLVSKKLDRSAQPRSDGATL
jgi:transcriptional regulator with XRE-family HTH domain